MVYFLYPETSNRTLEDIDEYFDLDSGHRSIIPIGDKTAKSTARPQEAIDAEVRRVTTSSVQFGKKLGDPTTVHVEDADS